MSKKIIAKIETAKEKFKKVDKKYFIYTAIGIGGLLIGYVCGKKKCICK